ncbi:MULTISPECIES: HAD family hydrolase [unclassified Streptomyces]|uniref:HAD family hydrolase n=1 Tax=unclassified Streptomyces TaxID=2593676 RepID=UPI00403CB9CB
MTRPATDRQVQPPPYVHVVWDWNGTLKDDVGDLLDAVNHSLAGLRAAPIDLATYQARHTVPIRAFYDRLLNRPVTNGEWARAQADFVMFLRARPPRLRPGVEQLLDHATGLGHSQSLLSLHPHDLLVEETDRLAITGHFSRIDGRRGHDGTKAGVLADHLAALPDSLRSRPVLVIGDSVDDARAAHAVGARAVLHSGGLDSAHTLRRAELAFTPTLEAALALGLRQCRTMPRHRHTPLAPADPTRGPTPRRL